ncbi:MAG: fused MFS/spermidine synthase [Phycisphaeraceae bacterium]|nr:fused MFS/spermidine synthase [Phycisphaeraceae bacterium]
MLPLLVITVLLSAALMFTLQPLVARLLLPVLGGSPAVWNTCMVFFQAVLLAGYAYAHVIGGWKRPRLAAAVHMGVLAVAVVALPVALPAWAMDPPTGGGQSWWVLLALLAVAGLPMFAVSATAPLAQRLLASTRHIAAGKPYFLYAASNAGSLLALLSYPVLIEPGVGLREQGVLWTSIYIVFVGAVLGCLTLAHRVGFGETSSASNTRREAKPAPERASAVTGGAGTGTAWRQRAWWLALSAVPSSLLLGVTNYLSTDVAAIPLLWVLPLAVYLVTFIIAFSERARAGVGPSLTLLMLPVVALSVALTVRIGYALGIVLAQQLLLLFVGALACHVELARRAPVPARLTEFYLFVSLGGVLGGGFNALLAPMVFDSVLEYPLAVVCTCLAAMLAAQGQRPIGPLWRHVVLGLLIGGAAAGAAVGIRAVLDANLVLDGRAMRLLSFAPGLTVALLWCRPKRVWFAMVLTALLGLAWNEPLKGDEGGGRTLHTARTFFGVHRVNQSPSGRFHTLSHGTTVHGLQFVTDDLRELPTMYYHPTGPIGHVFAALALQPGAAGVEGQAGAGGRRVAVVGLGAGALAAYCREEYRVAAMDFYEIDPEVVRIARDTRLFTYVTDAEKRGAAIRFVIGDGRLELARAMDKQYDLIVLDAFSSDAIPVHLLTHEAVAVYRSRLAPRGIIAVHISNRHIDLVPVLDALARAESPPMVVRFATDPTPPDELRQQGKVSSQWAVLARDAADLRVIEATPGMFWGVPDRPLGARAWTDDWADVVSQLRVWK